MNRRELYEFGEPFGACCTRREAGRLICGGGGDSSSSADTNSQVINQDNRLAVSNGVGQTGSGNTLTITSTTTDAGALKLAEASMLEATRAAERASASAQAGAASQQRAASQTTAEAFKFATVNNATNAAGFEKLLDVGLDMFSTNIGTFEKLVDKQFAATENTQALTAQAYQTATAEKSGSIDNKTIMVLGLAGAAALAFTMRKG